MGYRLLIAPKAYEELDRYIEYLAVDQQSPAVAGQWLTKALAALRTLTAFPNRCPPAPESEPSRHTIRMLVVDRCLFLYRVDETACTVRVLGFRNTRQLPLDVE